MATAKKRVNPQGTKIKGPQGTKTKGSPSRTVSSSAKESVKTDEVKRLLAHQAGRLKILEAMEELGPLLTTTDMREVQQRAIAAAMRLTQSQAGSLLLIDPETNELYFDIALGEKGEQFRTVRLKAGEGIAGHVARTGEPLIIHDVSADRRFSKRMDHHSGFTSKSILCVPVTMQGKRVGVLETINKRKGKFNKIDLEGLVALATQIAIAVENSRLYQELRDTFFTTASALGDAIEAKDAYTAGHTRRVMGYSLVVAQHLGLPKESLDALSLSAVLHDIGKIGIADHILLKPGKLNPDEMRIMQTHSVIGAKIVENVPRLKAMVPGILHHHERYDGSGYPDALRGEDIPQMARIIAICDTFDAMTSNRPYRQGMPQEKAAQELQRCAGTQFDSDMVEVFIEALNRGEMDPILRHDQKTTPGE